MRLWRRNRAIRKIHLDVAGAIEVDLVQLVHVIHESNVGAEGTVAFEALHGLAMLYQVHP